MKQLLMISLSLLFIDPAFSIEKASEERLDEVARRGAHVMPFDLNLTTHVFTKTRQGGIQQVIVKDPENTTQIKLIREHLQKIADEFRQGVFSDPSKIHGDSMPGLQSLKQANPEQLKIEYQKIPQGAQITYTAKNPELITAIHQWFNAQLTDHARHAVSGHAMHHKNMHP